MNIFSNNIMLSVYSYNITSKNINEEKWVEEPRSKSLSSAKKTRSTDQLRQGAFNTKELQLSIFIQNIFK